MWITHIRVPHDRRVDKACIGNTANPFLSVPESYRNSHGSARTVSGNPNLRPVHAEHACVFPYPSDRLAAHVKCDRILHFRRQRIIYRDNNGICQFGKTLTLILHGQCIASEEASSVNKYQTWFFCFPALRCIDPPHTSVSILIHRDESGSDSGTSIQSPPAELISQLFQQGMPLWIIHSKQLVLIS